jgi:hypothetical protein
MSFPEALANSRIGRRRAPALGRLRVAGLIALGSAAACGRDPSDTGAELRFPPTAEAVLSVGNPGKDEDPSVLRARDGSIYVAWFSDRTASGDIYITRTERARSGVRRSG